MLPRRAGPAATRHEHARQRVLLRHEPRASRLSALCKSMISPCRLSLPLPSGSAVNRTICSSATSSEASNGADARIAARRATAASAAMPSPAFTARSMASISCQMPAPRFASPGAEIRSPRTSVAWFTSVSDATGSRPASRHSRARAKRALFGSRARWAAACKILSRSLTLSLAARPSAIREGSSKSTWPSCSMISDFIALVPAIVGRYESRFR